MSEFMSVGKKLKFDDENVLVLAFKAADTSSSGKLNMEEFVLAYEAMSDIIASLTLSIFIPCSCYFSFCIVGLS